MSNTVRIVVLIAGALALIGIVGWAWNGQTTSDDRLLAAQFVVFGAAVLALGYWR